MINLRELITAFTISAILAVTVLGGVSCHLHVRKRIHPGQHQFPKFDDSSQHRSRSAGLPRLPSLTENCKDRPAARFSFALNDLRRQSGGFGDRMRGMVTTYYLALMSNSSFSVDWSTPYNLSDYFSVRSCVSRSGVKIGGQEDPLVPSRTGPEGASSSEMSGGDKIVRHDVNVYTYFTESLFTLDIGKNVDRIYRKITLRSLTR